MRKQWMKVGWLLGLALVLTACGAADSVASAPTPTPTLDPESPEYTITLTEFKFRPDRIQLRVGQDVTFHVVNHGATDHEIMIGRNPLRDADGDLGDGFEHDFFATANPQVEGDVEVMGLSGDEMNMDMSTPSSEAAGDTEEMNMETPSSEMAGAEEAGHDAEMMNGFMAMFQPQQEATITFHVTEDMLGTWTMGCFEEDQGQVHFDEGMAGIVTVLPAD